MDGGMTQGMGCCGGGAMSVFMMVAWVLGALLLVALAVMLIKVLVVGGGGPARGRPLGRIQPFTPSRSVTLEERSVARSSRSEGACLTRNRQYKEARDEGRDQARAVSGPRRGPSLRMLLRRQGEDPCEQRGPGGPARSKLHAPVGLRARDLTCAVPGAEAGPPVLLYGPWLRGLHPAGS